MEYNTLQKKLVLPEYGRHVHTMIQYAVNIKDRNERNIAAHTIIGIMGNLMPHLRDIPDFKHKLWDHLFIISGFKLDIDAPYPRPSAGELVERPRMVPYPQTHVRQKHYGKILVDMIREAGKIKDPESRDTLVRLLSTQMKKTYQAWNRSELGNDLLIQDIWDISDGKIRLNPESVPVTVPVRESADSRQNVRGKKRRPPENRGRK